MGFKTGMGLQTGDDGILDRCCWVPDRGGISDAGGVLDMVLVGYQAVMVVFQTGDEIPDAGGVLDMVLVGYQAVMVVFQTGDGIPEAGGVPNMG